MEKKFYIKPQAEAIEIDATELLVLSPGGAKLSDYEGEEWADE